MTPSALLHQQDMLREEEKRGEKKNEEIRSSLENINLDAWLKEPMTLAHFKRTQSESDAELENAMNLAITGGSDLLIRASLVKAKSLRDTIQYVHHTSKPTPKS